MKKTVKDQFFDIVDKEITKYKEEFEMHKEGYKVNCECDNCKETSFLLCKIETLKELKKGIEEQE